VRKGDGRYECAYCGAILDVSAEDVPTVVFHASSAKPLMRVVLANGREIHRCEVAPRESSPRP
jgi:hypothetical protein